MSLWAIGEKGNAEALNDRERRHSEVGAPVRQDSGSLVVFGNGASIEDVQALVGHADISTIKLYDHRRMNPEKSPSFNVNY